MIAIDLDKLHIKIFVILPSATEIENIPQFCSPPRYTNTLHPKMSQVQYINRYIKNIIIQK